MTNTKRQSWVAIHSGFLSTSLGVVPVSNDEHETSGLSSDSFGVSVQFGGTGAIIGIPKPYTLVK